MTLSVSRNCRRQLSKRSTISSFTRCLHQSSVAQAESKPAAKAKVSSPPQRRVAYVDGVRTPFKASGTDYEDLMAVDLCKMALKGLMDRTILDPAELDYIYMGTVSQDIATANIAREASVGSGIPKSVPSHTITMACISANQCICTGTEKILSGQADTIIGGGVETFSDVPIRFSRPLRKRFLKMNKALKGPPLKKVQNLMKLFSGTKLADLAPQPPSIKNFTTDEVMGHSSDRLSARFGVSRADQDEFALRSHTMAAKAHAEGIYKDDIIPFNGSIEENLIRGDATLEKMTSLKPAFIKPHGTHTPANSSALTDGAAASLIMLEEKAKALGYQPKALMHTWDFVAVDPFEDLLLGPAHAIDSVLKKSGLTLADIDVFELHEAFAGQVLSNLTAISSADYCKEAFGRSTPIGEIPMEKLNVHGGSISLGHPFGATGSRLMETAANRLIREDGKFALIAACADGGLGHACIIERA